MATYGTRQANLAGEGTRPSGVWLMHSEDGGQSWEEPLCVWYGSSCANNRMWFDGGNRFRLFYSRSGFCLMEIERKDNSICCVEAEVK